MPAHSFNWFAIIIKWLKSQIVYIFDESFTHINQGYEEFYVIEGELQDADGKVFKKGDFVTFEPGTEHNSHTKNGCLLIVFMRGINKPI